MPARLSISFHHNALFLHFNLATSNSGILSLSKKENRGVKTNTNWKSESWGMMDQEKKRNIWEAFEER